MTPAEIAANGNGPRVIRNKASIQATVKNAQEVLAVLDAYGSILPTGSFPDARAASANMRLLTRVVALARSLGCNIQSAHVCAARRVTCSTVCGLAGPQGRCRGFYTCV
jgi:3-methyladenine DNA glycosylase Tag